MNEGIKSAYSKQAFEAFENRDLQTLKSILNENIHPDELVDSYNNTLLNKIGNYHFTLKPEQFEIFKLLLEYGANPNIDEYNPLIHRLCKRKEVFSEEMIQLAISYKADIYSFSYDEKNSLLQTAAYYGKTWFVKHLINQGLDINYENTKGENALYNSINAFNSNIETIQCLLDSGANKSDLFKLHNGKLILQNLIGNKTEVLKYLISLGIDINAKNKDGYAIIVISAEYGPAEMFNEILELGADLDDCLGNVLHRIEYRMRDKGSKRETVEIAFEKLKILYNRKYTVAIFDPVYYHNKYDILTQYAESLKNRKVIKKYEETIILALLDMGFRHSYKKSFLEYLEQVKNIKIKNYIEENN